MLIYAPQRLRRASCKQGRRRSSCHLLQCHQHLRPRKPQAYDHACILTRLSCCYHGSRGAGGEHTDSDAAARAVQRARPCCAVLPATAVPDFSIPTDSVSLLISCRFALLEVCITRQRPCLGQGQVAHMPLQPPPHHRRKTRRSSMICCRGHVHVDCLLTYVMPRAAG